MRAAKVMALRSLAFCSLALAFGPLGAQGSPGTKASPAPSPMKTAEGADLRLEAALAELRAELSWDSLGGRGIVQRGTRSLSFVAGGESVLRSDGKKEETAAPAFEGGSLVFPAAFIALAKAYFEAPETTGKFSVAAILIDPGHGGKDPGAIGEHGKGKAAFSIIEKTVTLEVAKLVYDRLALAFPAKRVLLTRSRDQYLSLPDRADIANSVPLKKDEAAIFVSIHVNSALTRNARGFEVWYLDPSIRRKVLSDAQRQGLSPDLIPIYNEMMEEEITTESILLASSLLRSLDDAIGSMTVKRGIKAEMWYVVKNSLMPSALVELPFASNDADARLLKDPAYLQKMAAAIYTGIASFISYFESSKGFTD
jgi:N-acetylmuramoyl-L-alanine amidase